MGVIMIERQAKEAEIERNLDAFLRLLPEIIGEHAGEYALLRAQKIVDFYPSALDAQIAGNQRFPDSLFSIQLVDDAPEELGYFSHAVDIWRA